MRIREWSSDVFWSDHAEQVDPQLIGATKAAQRVVKVLVDFGRVAAEPVEGRVCRFEFLVETAEGQPLDQGTAALGALALALATGDQARGAIECHGLEIRAAENCPVQTGAVKIGRASWRERVGQYV